MTLYNSTLPAVTAQLNTLTQALATQFDEIQATGLGSNGPITSLTSQRTVGSVNQPLADAGLLFPPQAGDLYVTVTNLTTGQKTLSKFAIDPATESLTAIAGAISAVPNMQAAVDPQERHHERVRRARLCVRFQREPVHVARQPDDSRHNSADPIRRLQRQRRRYAELCVSAPAPSESRRT